GETGRPVVGAAVPGVVRLVRLAEGMVPGLEGRLHAVLVGNDDVAAEEVRIGHEDRAVGAVELDIVVTVADDVPARADGDDGAGRELPDAVDGRRRAHLDRRALVRAL